MRATKKLFSPGFGVSDNSAVHAAEDDHSRLPTTPHTHDHEALAQKITIWHYLAQKEAALPRAVTQNQTAQPRG